MAGGAQALQRLGLVPLGETFALRICQQFMMIIGGRPVAQQCLEEAMYVAGLEQVLAASHDGDTLQMVIDGHCQMVAGWRIFSGQDHVAKDLGPGLLKTRLRVMPSEGGCRSDGLVELLQ